MDHDLITEVLYMLGGVVAGLALGWVLAMFGVDNVLIRGIMELTGKTISNAGYYTIFAFIGAIGGAITDLKQK